MFISGNAPINLIEISINDFNKKYIKVPAKQAYKENDVLVIEKNKVIIAAKISKENILVRKHKIGLEIDAYRIK